MNIGDMFKWFCDIARVSIIEPEHKHNKHKRWTEDEIEVLATTTLDDHELSLLLGRTVAAIKCKRYSLHHEMEK